MKTIRSLLAICPLLLIPVSGYSHLAETVSVRASEVSHPFAASHAPHFLLVKKWDDLSERDKRRIREAQDRYERMPRDKRENLREKWERMPAREKEKYRIERKYR